MNKGLFYKLPRLHSVAPLIIFISSYIVKFIQDRDFKLHYIAVALYITIDF